MEQAYAESSQININQMIFAAAVDTQTIKIPAGSYIIDECYIQVIFTFVDLANTRNICARREFPLFFQGQAKVKVDGVIYGDYQSLLQAQQAYYYLTQYIHGDKRQLAGDIGYLPHINLVHLSQGASGNTRLSYQWPLRCFLPFIFPSEEKFFRVKQQMEITIQCTKWADTLLQETIATGVLANVTATGLECQFLFKKYLDDKKIETKSLKYCVLTQEAAQQTTSQWSVPESNQVCNFQALLLQDVSPTALSIGNVTAANFTSSKIQRNGKNLINASSTQEARSQFTTYQPNDTGVLLLSQFTPGQKFEYKIQNQGAANTNMQISYLFQYENA